MIVDTRAAVACLLLAVLPSGACSVAANLSAAELIDEVDAIVRVEGSRPDYVIAYADRASTSSWWRRAMYFGFWFVEEVVEAMLDDDSDATEDELGRTRERVDDRMAAVPELLRPEDHVRELLLELPDEVGDDLALAGLAASRFGWIAHYDVHPLSRIVALDGLCRIASALQLPVLGGDLRRIRFVPPADAVVSACGKVRDGMPRRGARGPVDAAARASYVDALGACASEPLGEAHARIALVELLTEAFLAETEAGASERCGAALRLALTHLVEWLLIDLVRGRGSDVDVRLCAMEQTRRAGGPAGVPLLLAVMVAGPELMARGEPAYDPDPDVRLRLVHYCGQLRGERSREVLALEGRKGAVPVAPADFLAITALTETAYTSKLRIPAVIAMAWCLGRPRVDFDVAWIRDWRGGRQ
jgi:hypothetical protein